MCTLCTWLLSCIANICYKGAFTNYVTLKGGMPKSVIMSTLVHVHTYKYWIMCDERGVERGGWRARVERGVESEGWRGGS